MEYEFKCDFCRETNTLQSLHDHHDDMNKDLSVAKHSISVLENELVEHKSDNESLQSDLRIARDTNTDICSSYEERLQSLDAHKQKCGDLEIEIKKLREEIAGNGQWAGKHEELCSKHKELIQSLTKVQKEKDAIWAQFEVFKSAHTPLPRKGKAKVSIPVTPEEIVEKKDLEMFRAKIESQIRKEYEDKLAQAKADMSVRVSQIQRNLSCHEPFSEVKKKASN